MGLGRNKLDIGCMCNTYIYIYNYGAQNPALVGWLKQSTVGEEPFAAQLAERFLKAAFSASIIFGSRGQLVDLVVEFDCCMLLSTEGFDGSQRLHGKAPKHVSLTCLRAPCSCVPQLPQGTSRGVRT